jgi:hypothetical protein
MLYRANVQLVVRIFPNGKKLGLGPKISETPSNESLNMKKRNRKMRGKPSDNKNNIKKPLKE